MKMSKNLNENYLNNYYRENDLYIDYIRKRSLEC